MPTSARNGNRELVECSPSRALRLCQFTPCLWSGGTEERVARILKGLSRREFSLSWIGFGPVREALIDRAGPGVTVVPFARNSDAGIEGSLLLPLVATLRRLQPDIIHVHNWSTSLYGIAAARIAGVPVVIYGLGGQTETDEAPERRKRLMRALCPHVDRFTAVCDYLADRIATEWGAPYERIEVLRTGIRLETFRDPAPQAEHRTRLNLPVNAPLVGTVTVLRKVKRLEDLIDAFGALPPRPNPPHLVIAGNPSAELSFESLRMRARNLGVEDRLHCLGRTERPQDVLHALDVFVNCSAFEGVSNAILEAMATGLPVVATDVGGSGELIEDNVNGYLVPPARPAALGHAMDRLLLDPALRHRLGENGLRRVTERHGLEDMLESYRRLYLSLRPDSPRPSILNRLRQSLPEIARFLGEASGVSDLPRLRRLVLAGRNSQTR
jgi:glycosyltransferase involved in cell wall biosynthesis